MWKNYFITAYRNISRSKGFSIINITGLAIGLATCLLITLWIVDELSYDKHYSNSSRLYRIIYKSPNFSQTRTPHPMPLAMVKDFPEVENGVSISPIWGVGLTRPEFMVEYLDKKFLEKEVMQADSTFFEVFNFPMVEGNPHTALKEPYGLVITESTAKKYFGNGAALGKVLKIDGGNTLTVTGVVKDIPHNTHFTFDFLISYVTTKQIDRAEHNGQLSDYYTWNDFGHYNYILLKPGADYKTIESKIFDWIWSYIRITPEQKAEVIKSQATLALQPVQDIHLHSNLLWELGRNGRMDYVYAFAITALLILFIAIFNYMNLATARSEKRAREVGVKKTLGAKRGQLVTQFLSESFLLTILSFIVSLIMVELMMPLFQMLTDKSISLYMAYGAVFFGGIIIAVFVIGLLSGAYPSFFLTSYKPIEVLKGKIQSSSANVSLRKILVVFQFSISIFLIICALNIFNQIQYLKNRDIGFKGQQVIVLPTRSDRISQHFESFKAKLKENSSIVNVSGVSNVPGGQFNNNSIQWKADGEEVNSREVWVDDDFFNTLQIEMSKGRAFSKDFASDSIASFIVNETACRRMNIPEPVGQEITWYGDSPGTVKGKVIGVVKDFNISSLRENVAPLIIQRVNSDWQYAYTLVRVKPEDLQSSIRYIESVWKQFDPQAMFKYSFLDKDFESLYEAEERMSSIFWVFATLAIIIACLGLFGLAAFIAEQKTKEIGIRKVHGASTLKIIYNLSHNFGTLILISNILAWPVSYFVLRSWFSNFAYRANINWMYFVFATILTLVIGIGITVYQSYKASSQNPVVSLKYE